MSEKIQPSEDVRCTALAIALEVCYPGSYARTEAKSVDEAVKRAEIVGRAARELWTHMSHQGKRKPNQAE